MKRIELLKKLEWITLPSGTYCPHCAQQKDDGHWKDCELKLALENEIDLDPVVIGIYHNRQLILDITRWQITPSASEVVNIDEQMYSVFQVEYVHHGDRGQEIKIHVHECTK